MSDTQMFLAGDMWGADNSDFGGSMLPWKNFKALEKYNPARHDLLGNWKTPSMSCHHPYSRE